MNKLEYIWLSNVDISNKNKFRLIQYFESVENLYNCCLDDLIDLEIKDEICYKILNKDTKEKALKDLEYMKKNKINLISFEDKEYPKKFENLDDKPVSIYVKGNYKVLDNESIGIVGSRLALKESLEISRLVGNAFATSGTNVISGLAKGIDKYAHLGVLDSDSKNGGKAIGVVACGLDKNSFYPQENLFLYKRIIENNGAVVSEYPIETKPEPYYFPYRNRLISAFSDKIFVVQASNFKSGSMITVNFGLEQGKDIYVYKSKNMDNPYFEGNRMLIEEGAKIFKI